MWGNSPNLLNNIRIYCNQLSWPASQPPHIYKLSAEDSFLAFIIAYSGISLHTPAFSKLAIEPFPSTVSATARVKREIETRVADYERPWCLLKFTRLTGDYKLFRSWTCESRLVEGEMPVVYSNPVVGDSLIQSAVSIQTWIRQRARPDDWDWGGKRWAEDSSDAESRHRSCWLKAGSDGRSIQILYLGKIKVSPAFRTLLVRLVTDIITCHIVRSCKNH